jgi:hypothetical protein
MKKVLFVNFSLLLAVSSFAQVDFGLKGGVNFSSFTGADASGSSTLTGFYVGGLVNFPISTMFSVQPEAFFSQEGAKETGSDNKLSLSYVNIPVLLQYNSSRPSGFYAETGPQLGLLVSAKSKNNGVSVDVKSELKSTAISWALGLGYKLVDGFGFGARYAFGLTKIPSDQSNGGTDVKDNVISIGVFKMFGNSGEGGKGKHRK